MKSLDCGPDVLQQAVPSRKEMVLIENGYLKPVVHKTAPISQVVEVLSEFESGKLKGPGKLVLVN